MSSEEMDLDEEYENCRNETGASDKDLQQLENRVTPTTKQGKCLEACYLNYMQVVS